MQKSVVNMWDAVMNHEINPLKHIDDLQTRHVVMQFLAWMWCIIFSMSLGSWTIFGVSAVAHALLIAGVVAKLLPLKWRNVAPTLCSACKRGWRRTRIRK